MGYTVQAAVEDWLEYGSSGRSARTIQLYRDGVRPLTDRLGFRPLRKLSAADVRSALAALSEQLSTRSLQIAHDFLVRAIRHAEADDLVDRNVAALVRPLAVLLLTTGLRPEEAQALCWESRRSRRVDGRGVALGQGPQLTPRRPKSRRTLRLAQIAVDVLRRPDGNLLRSSLRGL